MMRFELLLLFAVFFSHWISIGCCTQQKVKSPYEPPQERDEAHKSAAVKRSLPALRPTQDAALWSCDSCSDVAANAPACDGVDDLQYDSTLASFNTVQENTSTREAGKTQRAKKDRRGKLRNFSRLQRDKTFVDEELPLARTEQEEIPTFHEWTKIMLEESEKSQIVSSGPHTASKTPQQTITNYASVECGAKILSSNPEAKSTSAVLMENMDMYMLNPCKNKIWFIIELCQPIQIKQLDIANFEIFSSNLKEFLISVSDRYPHKTWVKLGTFQARDERVVQSFMLDQHSFARYVKVELLSHFGSEHFCPLSLIRVFGTSMMEEYELSSETSDRTPLQDEQDSDPVGFPSVEDKTSDNLIGSAKDVLLTMVNNIAVNMLGGGEGNSSSGDSNSSLSHLLTSSSMPASAMSEVDAAITPASPAPCLPEDLSTPEPIVTLLPQEEEDNGSETHEELSGEKEDVTPLCLEDILLQRCPSQSFTQKTQTDSLSQVTQRSVSASITTSRTLHRDKYSPGARASDLSPSLSSELLLQVSRSSLTFTLSQPVELTYSSFSSVSTTPLPDPDDMIESEEPLPEIFPQIMKSSSSQTSVISSYQLVDGLVSEMVTPATDESPSTEMLDVVDSSVNMELILGEMLHNSSGAPHHSSSQKESVFMRLNNRIKALEMNMSLSGRYLEQLSQRYRKQVEEMQRAFNKTILKLQDTAKTAEEQDQRQTDSIQLLQVQLENVTSLLLGLSESVTQLQQEVANRQSCILLCLLLCAILVLLIYLNFHQLTETLDSEKELTDDPQVLPRNTVLCPLSQTCLQTTVENGASEENLCLEKCKPLPLKPCVDGPLISSGTCRTPSRSPSLMALDLQLCSTDTDAAASDTSSDETLFCGLGSCSGLCDALPRTRLWTDSSPSEHVQDRLRWPRL